MIKRTLKEVYGTWVLIFYFIKWPYVLGYAYLYFEIMIVHIVMFKFKDENKALNMARVQKKLEDLEESIDVLKSMEVGINFNESERAMDMSLYSTFESQRDLKTYQEHPEHQKVVELIKKVTEESRVVDYILE